MSNLTVLHHPDPTNRKRLQRLQLLTREYKGKPGPGSPKEALPKRLRPIETAMQDDRQ